MNKSMRLRKRQIIGNVYMYIFTKAITCFPGFSLALDRRARLGGLRGKAVSACKEFEGNEDGILGQCF